MTGEAVRGLDLQGLSRGDKIEQSNLAMEVERIIFDTKYSARTNVRQIDFEDEILSGSEPVVDECIKPNASDRVMVARQGQDWPRPPPLLF